MYILFTINSSFDRFATGRFSGLRRPTVGSDFQTKKMVVHDVEVTLQIWDTAGQERFNQGSIGSAFFRGAHGALLVYDVNDEKSIEQIAQWREECLSRQLEDEYFPMVVIGNKIDVREKIPVERRVDVSGVLTWCREHSYGHIETSAKDGHGVEAAMLAITGLALENMRNRQRRNVNAAMGGEKVNLESKYEVKKSGCEGCF
ncbi:GTP-binding protein [archaeon]|nr:MAG: GTP-binding protein [archaeon]